MVSFKDQTTFIKVILRIIKLMDLAFRGQISSNMKDNLNKAKSRDMVQSNLKMDKNSKASFKMVI